jgi:hypothetical protein
MLSILVAALAGSGGLDAATKKKATKPPPPIPADAELGFFDTTRDELLASIKRVGIMPVTDMPRELRERDDAKLLLQEAVAKYLKLANIEVVMPTTYQAAYDRFNTQLGGMYDPVTGAYKREVAAAVVSNARREYLSKEKLDGLAYVRVVMTGAAYSADWAEWDGVRDRSNGKPAPANALVDFMTADKSSGKIPAASLLLQIVNAQERVVYGRHGGIQLFAYHEYIKYTDIGFIQVPVKHRLNDAPRMDRAAREATLPLRFTPKEISLGAENPEINARLIDVNTLPPLPPGEPFEDASPLLVPRDQILAAIKRVAVSGFNPDRFAVPEEVQQRLMAGVKQELAPLGWELIDAPQARDIFVKELAAAKVFDPLTGKADEAKVSAIRKSIFNRLGLTPVPDAILWIGLDQTTELHNYADVTWDGVTQNAVTMQPVVKKFFGGSFVGDAGKGTIQAVSLSIRLNDANDTPLYRARGGLQLTQRLAVTPATYSSGGRAKAVDLAPSELFQDTSREMPAVHAALRHLVLTPEALALELDPDAAKKKKTKKK